MSDPLHQFEIHPLFTLPSLGGFDVSFTNSSLAMVASALLTLFVTTVAGRKAALIPSRFQSLGELLYSFVHSLVVDTAGKEAKQYFPFVFALFCFILFGNLFGMFPFAFTFTSHLVVTFALAAFVFLLVTLIGIFRHGLHFFSLFAPHGVPIPVLFILVPVELFSYFMRPLTLSLRLFANMMAGHIVLKVIVGMILGAGAVGILPFFLSVSLMGFEFFVACLQAYIFALLTCVYLKDAIHLH